MAKDKKAQLAKLKAAKKAGTLTDRQKTRLDFLKKQARTDRKKAGGGGTYKPNRPFRKLPEGTRKEVVGDFQTEKRRSYEEGTRANADVIGPTGTTSTEIDPITGKATQTTELSQNQKDILAGGEDLTKTGIGKAGDILENFQGFNPGDLGAMRTRIEDQVFASLTRDLDENAAREKDEIEQTLVNRGIPLDPANPLYQRYMEAFDKKYDRARLEAHQQAVQFGGTEMQNQFGMDLTQHQQQLTDIGGLQGTGTGLLMPNAPDYSSPNFNLTPPSSITANRRQADLAGKELGIKDKLAGIEAEKLALAKMVEENRKKEAAQGSDNAFPEG